jgi:hypothetical protein
MTIGLALLLAVIATLMVSLGVLYLVSQVMVVVQTMNQTLTLIAGLMKTLDQELRGKGDEDSGS